METTEKNVKLHPGVINVVNIVAGNDYEEVMLLLLIMTLIRK